MNQQEGSVVLLSGGMDSTTVLWLAMEQTDDVVALSFDYGQRHRHELDFAIMQTDLLGVPHHIVDLRSVTNLLKGSALTDSDVEVPHGHYAEDTMVQTIVPNRNSMMLNIAVAVAIGQGARYVYAAMHAGDHFVYPDCRPEFVNKLNELIPIATETDVEILVPFINSSKADIVTVGTRLGVRYETTWSCYEGGMIHCGRCGTCVERAEAFYLANVEDPTHYADNTFWRGQVGGL